MTTKTWLWIGGIALGLYLINQYYGSKAKSSTNSTAETITGQTYTDSDSTNTIFNNGYASPIPPATDSLVGDDTDFSTVDV